MCKYLAICCQLILTDSVKINIVNSRYDQWNVKRRLHVPKHLITMHKNRRDRHTEYFIDRLRITF